MVAVWEESESCLGFRWSAEGPSWMSCAPSSRKRRTEGHELPCSWARLGSARPVCWPKCWGWPGGFRVFSGACDELEQDRPLRALAEALEVERGAPDPQRAKIARLLGVGSGPPERVVPVAGMVDEGWLIVETVVSLLEDLASTAPGRTRR